MTFTIDPLAIPDTLEAPGGAEFIEMIAVRNAVEAEFTGSADASPTAQDILPHWQDPYSPQLLWVARVDGRIVGRGLLVFDVEVGSRVAQLGVEVLADFRRQGIGSALYDVVHAGAVAHGRVVLQGDFLTGEGVGERLASPTGFGSIPASDSTRFALARGYELQQVARASRLELPFAAAELLATAASATGPDFRVETWVGATPSHRVDDMAHLHSRMSTDAPAGGLEIPEEAWDAARVHALDELRAKTATETLVTAAEHVPTGRLVAFSELSVPRQLNLAVHQEDTLVLSEFRGHRLGMLVKLANLAALAERLPGHPAVVTFNAEENRPMLDVNEAIGFRAYAYEGAWKREL